MYTHIGVFDAKAKLSELLQEIKQGKKYTITLRGQPIADLIPNENCSGQNISLAIERMHNFDKVKNVSNEAINEWMAEGRL